MMGKLAALYQSCENDPQLLSIKSEVAIVGTRIHQLVDRVNGESGESDAAWKQLQVAWEDLRQANQAKNAEAAQEALRSIGEIIKSGVGEESQWRELLNLLDRKASLAAKEHARQRDLAGFLPIEEAMRFAAALSESVRRHVSDERIARAIALDIEKAIHAGPVGATSITSSRLGVIESAALNEFTAPDTIDGEVIGPADQPPAPDATPCIPPLLADAGTRDPAGYLDER